MKLGMIFGMALLICAEAFAQSDLVGKYSGHFSAKGFDNRGTTGSFTMVLEIKEADNGKLKGIIQNLQRGACLIGTGDARGTYEGSLVKITEIDGPDRPKQCRLIRFEGTVDGNKIVGKTRYNGDPYDLTLTRTK